MATTEVIRSERFPDLADEVLFPRLSDAKLAWLAKQGDRRDFQPGEVLYEHGVRDAPFYVLERGRVEFIDRKPGKDVYIAEADGRTFIGDIAVFTGEPTISACVAVEPTEVIAFDRAGLRDMLARWPEFGEHVFRTLLARREWDEAEGHGVMRLIAPRGSRRAFEVRDLLERNLLPVRWYDVDTDAESAAMLDWLQIPRSETPVLVHATEVMRNPSAAQVARTLGLRAQVDGERFDLVVLGAGPAGLASAVYAGSEGLRTFVAEAWAPGGQAGTSTRIENYLGFPTGISGQALAGRAFNQAQKFGAEIALPVEAARLVCQDRDCGDDLSISLASGESIRSRTVVIASGARYRRLEVDNLSAFEGAGVSYWASPVEARLCEGEEVALVGGGNSAGQAVVFLAAKVRRLHLIVRGAGLEATMSSYLIDRIKALPNVELHTHTEVVELDGGADGLTGATMRNRKSGALRHCALRHLFLFIGADPNSDWLDGCVETDAKGFVVTGPPPGAITGSRQPLLLETSRPGVFAIGDVRAGSTKRVAAAVGEGAAVVAQIHSVLALRNAQPA